MFVNLYEQKKLYEKLMKESKAMYPSLEETITASDEVDSIIEVAVEYLGYGSDA
jgi:hypothetical protein